jgi:hypothetical protein
MNRAYRATTSHAMSCTHGTRHHCRLKAGAGVLEGDVAGLWFCDVCHPPAGRLVEYGMIEWEDGRETLSLRCMEPWTSYRGQLRLDKPMPPAQAASEQAISESVKVAAPKPPTKKKAATKPKPKVQPEAPPALF